MRFSWLLCFNLKLFYLQAYLKQIKQIIKNNCKDHQIRFNIMVSTFKHYRLLFIQDLFQHKDDCQQDQNSMLVINLEEFLILIMFPAFNL